LAGAAPGASPASGGAPAQADPASPVLIGQIAGTTSSPEQAQALSQALLVNSDCASSEAQVAQTAASRRQEIAARLAAVRQNLAGFFTRTVVGMQTLVSRKQMEFTLAAIRSLTWVRTTFMSTLLAMRIQGILIRARINALITGISVAVQGRVRGIVGQIGGLINSVPLPDIPGVAQIRGVATALLNRAAGIVSAAFGQFMAFIQAAFNAGMNVLDAFLRGMSSIVYQVLVLATAVITNVIRVIAQALSRAITLITVAMHRILTGVITPLLNSVATLTGRLIGKAQQVAVDLLRGNRREYLAALLAAITPRPGSVTLAEARASTPASRVEAIRQLGRDALRNNRLITMIFDMLIGHGIAGALAALASAVTRMVAFLADMLPRMASMIADVVNLAVQSLARFGEVVANFVLELLQSMMAGINRIVQSVRTLVENALDRLLRFVVGAVQRVASFIVSTVRRLIGGGSAGSVAEATGSFTLAGPTPAAALALSGGPITKPLPPALEIALRLVFGAIVTAVGALMVFLFGAELAAIIMANPIVAVVILVILVVIGQFVLTRTSFGVKLKVTGSALRAAKFSGIDVERVILVSFVLAAFTATIAGLAVTSLSRVGAWYNGAGYDFKAVTAIVIGGMTLAGGRGSILGVLGGSLIIGILNNIMTLIGIGTFSQDMVRGAIFIIVVGINAISLRSLGRDDA